MQVTSIPAFTNWTATWQSTEVGGVGGFIVRQIFRNARSANVKVFDKGTEIAEMKTVSSFSQKLLQLVEQK